MGNYDNRSKAFMDGDFYFKVVEARVVSREMKATLKIAYDMAQNPEVTTYVRRAYVDKSRSASTAYNVFVNGLRVHVVGDGFDCSGEFKYTVDYIERQYQVKGYKKLSTGIGQKHEDPHQDTHKAEVVENPIKPEVKVQEPTTSDWSDDEVRHEKYETIKACLEANIPVYLAGPAGSGKNYTVEQICKNMGWDFYFSNSVQQEYKLTGFIDAGGRFHDTEFYKACTSKKDCVFFLDEMDASIPEVLVLLNAAIANGYFEFPTGRVDLKNVHFVAAGNTVGSGSDELYTGRLVIDQATLDRFAIIEFDYDIQVEMKLAHDDKQLVRFIHSLRDSAKDQGIRATFSYRAITMVVKLQGKMKLSEILKIAVFKGLDKDTMKQLVNGAALKGLGDVYIEASQGLVA